MDFKHFFFFSTCPGCSLPQDIALSPLPTRSVLDNFGLFLLFSAPFLWLIWKKMRWLPVLIHSPSLQHFQNFLEFTFPSNPYCHHFSSGFTISHWTLVMPSMHASKSSHYTGTRVMPNKSKGLHSCHQMRIHPVVGILLIVHQSLDNLMKIVFLVPWTADK